MSSATENSLNAEIALLEAQLHELYIQRNRMRGFGPVVVPKENTFTISEDFSDETCPVTITSVSEDGTEYTGTTTSYTDRVKDANIVFTVDPETREAEVVAWSHVTFTWDERAVGYYCDSYMCKERHRLEINRPDKSSAKLSGRSRANRRGRSKTSSSGIEPLPGTE